MTRLHDSHRFVFWDNYSEFSFQKTVRDLRTSTSPLTGIMWHVGGSVEKPVDAVAAVAPHHREAAGLRVFLDDVS